MQSGSQWSPDAKKIVGIFQISQSCIQAGHGAWLSSYLCGLGAVVQDPAPHEVSCGMQSTPSVLDQQLLRSQAASGVPNDERVLQMDFLNRSLGWQQQEAFAVVSCLVPSASRKRLTSSAIRASAATRTWVTRPVWEPKRLSDAQLQK